MSARPKRPGDSLAGVSLSGQDGPSSKKPRFDYRNPSTLAADAPEEDAILDLDEIGLGNTTKRNAVNLDGYDSDSDNDNFNERANAKSRAQAKAAKSKNEDDADMFANLEDAIGDEDEDLAAEGKKKKDVRFLDINEIEGQVADSKSGGHVSADFSLGSGKANSKSRHEDQESSSDEDDDELRDHVPDEVDEELGAGAKKKHAPKLDAFNMRSENEEGAFDASGNYIRKANDPDGRHDQWLEGVSKKDMKKAKDAAEKREEERQAKNRADDALLTSDLLDVLIKKLDRGETTLEALARLGRGVPKKRPRWANKNKNSKKQNGGKDEMDLDTIEDTVETRRKATVEEITEAADQLLTRGQVEIYDQEREILMRQYLRETGEDWIDQLAQNDDSSERMWEYRWADGREGEVTHGPYDGPTMRAWNEAGYFLEGVEFRANDSGEWFRIADF